MGFEETFYNFFFKNVKHLITCFQFGLEMWFRVFLIWRYLCFSVWHRLWRLSPFRSDIVQMFTFLFSNLKCYNSKSH